jgi:hypothetical protein
MRREVKTFLNIFVSLLICWSIAGNSILLAQATYNEQEFDEEVRAAYLYATIDYIIASMGILLTIGGILLWIYSDSKKKARKQARQQTRDMGRPSKPETPQR